MGWADTVTVCHVPEVPNTDCHGSDETDNKTPSITTDKPKGGFAGTIMTVMVTGEDVGMAEEAHELPPTKEGPTKCILCGCEAIDPVHKYPGCNFHLWDPLGSPPDRQMKRNTTIHNVEGARTFLTKKCENLVRAKGAVVAHGKKTGETVHTPADDDKTSEANC